MCGNCKYAIFKKTDKGNIKRKLPGECTYEIKRPKLPLSFTRSFGYSENMWDSKNKVWYKYEECEVFEPRLSKESL